MAGLTVPLAKPLFASDFQTKLRVAGLKGTFDCAIRQGVMTKYQAKTTINITLDKRGIPRKYLSDPNVLKASNIMSSELRRLKVDCSDPYGPDKALQNFTSKSLKRIENLLD